MDVRVEIPAISSEWRRLKIMRKHERFTMPVKYLVNPPDPKPLFVDADTLAMMDSNYGDIVTLGSKDNIARDRCTGLPIPLDQRFVLTPKR